MKLLLQTILFFSWVFATAQDVKFTAKVSRNQVATHERFEVRFELNNNGSNFRPPDMSGFHVLSGPNQSQSMQWINGNMTSSISYGYILQPTQEGTFTIGSASVQVGGNTYKTDPIQIKVIKGNPPASQNGGQQQGGQQQGNRGSGDVSEHVFIRLNVDKNSCYVGEPIIATYKIYTRLGIANNSVSSLPTFNGFWTKEIELPGQSTLVPEVLNGVQYNAAVLKKTILFPQQSGELEIDGLSMDLVVQINDNSRPRSIFDQVFGRVRNVEYEAVSNKQKIKVKQHPTGGKPNSFTGAVGHFNISATVDKTEVNTNDAINFNVTLKGAGNIELIEKLPINFPADFEIYDPKVADKITATTSGVNGTRTFEYVIIPRYAGTFIIPAIEFSYFDPAQAKYTTLQTGEISITVAKGAGDEQATTFAPANKEDVKVLGKDIRFIKTDTLAKLQPERTHFFKSALFWLLFIIPFPLAGLLFFVRRQIQSSAMDVLGARSRRANREAVKHLKKASEHMKSGQRDKFYEELTSCLFGYLSARLKIPMADLNRETIQEKLMRENISTEIVISLISVLDTCEMARYAPVQGGDPQSLYAKSAEIISKIEGAIK